MHLLALSHYLGCMWFLFSKYSASITCFVDLWKENLRFYVMLKIWQVVQKLLDIASVPVVARLHKA